MKKIAIFLYIFFVSIPAYGKSTVLYQTENSVIEVEDKTIYIGGSITRQVANVLLTIDPKKYSRVSLHSWGGWVQAATDIAKFIHVNKLNTYVGRDKGCYSACTIIYQAGKIRTAHKSAKFMYHYAHKYKNEKIVVSGISTIKYLLTLEKFGVPERFFRLWPRNGGPLYLTAQETMPYNVVQMLIK